MPSEHNSPTAGRRRADDRRFDAGIAHLHRYVAAHGSSSPPRDATIDGFRIGAWVDSRRTDYRLGRLSPERIRRIETEFPDWRWNVLDAAFAAGIDHLRRYAATHGTSNPRQHDVIDDFPIGQWAANRRADYRTGRLPPDRIALLDNEFQDWQWNPQDAASAAAFETGLAHLHRYRVVHGTSNPRQRDVIDGFAIGQWVANRRADYRLGRLSADRVRRLETEFPNWRWTVRGRS
ncbi:MULTISPECIES: helicase associated domain-containing protein [unclassified Gordonia (in: high G+C Gram-positive bacteria)]|uniref:helicase associated domain-containing protein n=1 Tax=unclassified Gordonia (in: high G+C Gram-positive bacteria) TaxID=2657482 RepID=UPI001963A8DE|nr:MULTISPECIES: helicase associated domain-containing protein [unclassified Gordonia (in: high G+C Gram-positive bacteria)]MBN0975077.1 helicase associated domain-containing protein [Gordonia sp. BP-119]MBN0985250.1 helicase associated domain-containing protein [Gordonia sp. BP-94]